MNKIRQTISIISLFLVFILFGHLYSLPVWADQGLPAARHQLEQTLHESRRIHPCAVKLMSITDVQQGINSRALSIVGYNPYDINDMKSIARTVIIPNHVIDFVTALAYQLNPSVATEEQRAYNRHRRSRISQPWRLAKLNEVSYYKKVITLLRAIVATNWMRNKERQKYDLNILIATIDDVKDLGSFLTINNSTDAAVDSVFARAHYRVTTEDERVAFHLKYDRLLQEYNGHLSRLPTIERVLDIQNYPTLSYEDQQLVLMHLKFYYQLAVLKGARKNQLTAKLNQEGVAYGALLIDGVSLWLNAITKSASRTRTLRKQWSNELQSKEQRIVIEQRLNNWLRVQNLP